MKKFLLILYKIYLPLVLVVAITLPILHGFGIEYVLLWVQALLATLAWLSPDPKNIFRTKHRSELSLGIVVLFVGILYYATFHILVVALSALVLAGWFGFQEKTKAAEGTS